MLVINVRREMIAKLVPILKVLDAITVVKIIRVLLDLVMAQR